LPEQTAIKDRGYISLYNGLDLRGWKTDDSSELWKSDNWKLVTTGNDLGDPKSFLWTENEFQNFNMIIDWRLTGEPVAKSVSVIMPDGKQAEDSDGKKITVPIRYTGEGGIFIRGSDKVGVRMTSWPEGSGGFIGYREEGVFDPETRKSATPILNADLVSGEWNRMEMSVIDNQISVILNGKVVIRNATIKELSEKGSIGIQVPDFPMEFANIYIREL
jgi:hypothetical protein